MEDCSLILGFFDGVHKGHQAVINSAFPTKKAILLTFQDSPSIYFGKNIEYIYPREKNYELIKSLGVDEIVEQDFSKLADVNAQEYLENNLIKQYSPNSISTGFNYTFGAKRGGNPKFLEDNQTKYHYKYFCAEPFCISNETVSSTKIREFLRNGNLEKANEFLGRNFSIKSTVIEGQKLGRQIGFPTANLQYPTNIVKLPHGVYSVKVFGKPAVLNWGIKPTVNGKNEILEVHIPNFEKDLYNTSLEIEFVKKLREEKQFANLEELKQQIKKDIEECLK